MVEKRLLYVNASKQTNEDDDGFNRFMRVDIKDCEVKKLSSKNVIENDLSHGARYDYDSKTDEHHNSYSSNCNNSEANYYNNRCADFDNCCAN